MTPVRRHVAQRQEHEGALMEPWMRQDRRCPGDADAPLIVEKIEIERAGGIGLAPDPPEAGLDAMKKSEKVGG